MQVTSPIGFQLWFEVEERCNLSCRFCYCAGASDSIRQICDPLGIAKRILDSLPIEIVTLTGGEPLLCPDIEAISRAFQSNDVPVIIATNGCLLTKERLERLIKSGVRTFQIPILSASPEVHNYLTDTDSWNNTLASVLRARESGCCTVIVFIATRRNLSDFVRVLEIAAILGIKQVIFNRFISARGRAHVNQHDLSIQDTGLMMDVLHKGDCFAFDNGIRIVLGTPISSNVECQSRFSSSDGGYCTIRRGTRSLTVDAAGNVRLCPLSSRVVGNMAKNDPIKVSSQVSRNIEMLRSRRFESVCLLEQHPEFRGHYGDPYLKT